MLTKSQARAFFVGGTIFFTAILTSNLPHMFNPLESVPGLS